MINSDTNLKIRCQQDLIELHTEIRDDSAIESDHEINDYYCRLFYEDITCCIYTLCCSYFFIKNSYYMFNNFKGVKTAQYGRKSRRLQISFNHGFSVQHYL